MRKTIQRSIIACLFVLCLVFPASGHCSQKPLRALFVSVLQDPPVLSSRTEMEELIAYARRARISMLFVQVYRANQAWFPSTTADQSPYRAARASVGADPFELLIDRAHAAGIEVHAWVNLLSLGANSRAPMLEKFGTGILTCNRQKKTALKEYKIDDQYFLEPGDPCVRQELVTIVEELLRSYPRLDGIQFDYIRYPDMHPFYGHTKANLERFTEATGCASALDDSPLWKDWKRRQVTELVQLLASKTRQLRPALQISTTACVPYVRAYEEAFQDWPQWLNSGLVDFVTLMSYPPTFEEFHRYVAEARSKVPPLEKIIIAVGAYKLTRSPETFDRQFRYCESLPCKACAVLHYGSLVEEPGLGRALLGQRQR